MASEQRDFYKKVTPSGRSDVDLTREAKRFPELARSFIGVFNKDTLPKLEPNQCAIVNIQASRDGQGRPLNGTHWIAAGKKQNEPWSIDSYGLPPPMEVLDRLGTSNAASNNKTIQSADSSYCGDFSLCACILMNSNPHASAQQVIQRYVNLFDRLDLTQNDRVVENFLKQRAMHSSHHGVPYETYIGGNK